MTYKLNWPKRRAKQLDDLRKLIHEVQTINNGNRVIERLRRVITMADKLTKFDHDGRHPSFMNFLDNLCIEPISEDDGHG